MNDEAVLEGMLHEDGSLHLDEKPNLPPGRVRVVVQSVPALPADDPFWDMMKSIWAAQKARGFIPRSAKEVEAERERTRDEWEEHSEEIERLQEECSRLRGQPPC
jgi:hypothetical protein